MSLLRQVSHIEYYTGIGRQSLDSCDRGVAMVSDDQIKFLAAGREHSHVVSQDEQGRLCSRILHFVLPQQYLMFAIYRPNEVVFIWK
jgi:hypothetical protein